MTPTHGELFAGGGGLTLAVEAVYGARTVWHVENEPAACRVLDHNWPGVPNLGDINDLEPGSTPLVQILSGGFPCTDVASIGRRAGLRPGTRSGLWSKFHAVIADQTARALASDATPPLVIIENVRGLTSASAHSDVERCPDCLGDPSSPPLRALGAVLGGLADLGFDAEWGLQSAASAGLAHFRERVWVVAAHADSIGRLPGPLGHGEGDPARSRRPAAVRGNRFTPGWGRYASAVLRAQRVVGRPAPASVVAGPRGGRLLSPHFVEWLMAWPEGHVADVPGVTVEDALRILGNGVSPPPAELALPQLHDRLTTEGPPR